MALAVKRFLRRLVRVKSPSRELSAQMMREMGWHEVPLLSVEYGADKVVLRIGKPPC